MNPRSTAIAALAITAALVAGIGAGCATSGASKATRQSPATSAPSGQPGNPDLTGPAPTAPAPTATPSTGRSTGPASGPRTRSTRSGGGSPVAAPGRLAVDRSAVNLGSATSGALTLRNTGGSPLTWTAASSAATVTLSPAAGALRPGATQRVTVSLSNPPDGRLSERITFTGAGNVLPVTVTADVDIAPTISNARATHAGMCVGGPSEVHAEVRDAQGVARVVLTYGFFPDSGAASSSGQADMRRWGPPDTYYAAFGPFSEPGLVYYAVHAYDVNGHHRASAESQIRVRRC